MLGSKRLCSAVSPMSAAPTSDTEKKNRNGANLKLRLALRAGGVIDMEVNLCHSVVPQACNVILQCMHVYKVFLSHSNGSSSARRLKVDEPLHNY